MPDKLFSPKLIKFFAMISICLSLVFLNPKGLFDPVRKIFFEIIYPIQKTFYLASKSISGAFGFLGSISELKLENSKLIKENNILSAEIAGLRSQQKENESLRQQLNLAPREKFNLEAGLVIGQDPQRLESWLMIDKGAADGINAGMPVIAYEGILVGKISEVYDGNSKITLLSDSSSIVNAVDLETGAKGVVRGEYGLGTVIDMIPQTEIISEGDTVATSGLGSGMPKGLLIGKIVETRLSDDKLFQQATVAPRIKYSKLDMVFVIKN